MQIHEITESHVDEALGGLGSFMSGLTGGMSDKYMDKTPGGVKQGLTGFRANPNDYGPNAQLPSTEWKDKYKALDTDPAVASYVKNIGASWLKNSAATASKPTQGLATGATLQRTIPSLVTAAKKTNNNLTSTQIGQLLAQSAPTVWKNTPDKPDTNKPEEQQVYKAKAIRQLAAELIKQGVTVDGKQAPVAKTAGVAPTAPVAKTAGVAPTAPVAKTAGVAPTAKSHTGGKVAGQLSQTPGAVAKLNARAQAKQPNMQPNVAGANAFDQMAKQLTSKPVQTTQSAATTAATPAKARATYPKAPAPGTIAEPPVFLGGKKLDPKKPGDAKTLAAIRNQGRLNEAVTTGPAADQYRATFTKWADGQFASRVKETGTTVTMDAVRKAFPDLAADLKSAADKVVAARGTPQQAQAVEEYAKLAVAGVQALAQKQKNKISAVDRGENTQIDNIGSSIKQALSQAGVDPGRLSQIGANQSARRTGNPAADGLLKLSGFRI